MTVPRNLCLFDLDGTLLPIDSDHAFGDFMIEIGWVDAEAHRARNDGFYRDYLAGTLDQAAYVDFATSAWRHRSPEEIADVRRRYMDEVVQPQLRPEARALVRDHQDRGDLVAIVTATSEFVTGPIAQAFGVAHLLAVQLGYDELGRCTGRIVGTPTFQGGKVLRVNEWLRGLGRSLEEFERISVYSDSTNDLPLLEMATDAVATNPSPGLADIAQARGWRILNLFDSPAEPETA